MRVFLRLLRTSRGMRVFEPPTVGNAQKKNMRTGVARFRFARYVRALDSIIYPRVAPRQNAVPL